MPPHRVPIPPRPLEQRQDLVVPPPALPTEGHAAEWHSAPGHRTVIPPGRTLLPEPDTGRLLDDPLTSPRYSRDARSGGQSGSRGFRSDWLTGREGITRPATSPPAPPAPPAPAAPAAPPAPPVQPEQRLTTEQPAPPAGQTWTAQPPASDRGQRGQALDGPAEEAGHPGAPAVSHAASPSADPAASQPSSEPAEPVMRSVWEPLTRHRPSPARPASEQTVEHPSPIARPGTWASPAWEARLSEQPGTISQTEPVAASPAASAPDSEAAGPAPAAPGLSTESAAGQPPPGLVPRQPTPPSAEPLSRPQPQLQAEPLPRRQPMTHLAAPLRRDRQSEPGRQAQPGRNPEAGGQHQADPAEPMPSVWDTWRPAAAARRAAQAEGSDPADDNP